MREEIKIFAAALILTLVIFLISLISWRPPTLGPIENIHGIPYPIQENNSVVITEPLAHADINLFGPVLTQELRLEINYRPVNLSSLAVGVREDSFWLSYGSRQPLSVKNGNYAIALITIPLTDKLQEPDRSIDLMFFAEAENGEEPQWELSYVHASTINTMPTYAQFRNYVGSILKRERAL